MSRPSRRPTTPAAPAAPSRLSREATGDPAIEPLKLALAIAEAVLDKKAENPALLDVGSLVSYADYVLIVTATAVPHAEAIRDAAVAAGKALGVKPLAVEGSRDSGWTLVDFGDLILHVFREQDRGFYDLEGLWDDARRVQIPGVEAPALEYGFRV